MDDAQRTQRILRGRFIAGAALPYTDEYGITWSVDFADVKGITRRMVQAEARIHTLEAAIRAHRTAWRGYGMNADETDAALWALVPEEPA